MEKIVQDVRYGVRMLAKKPAFTFVVVLALALGIGANTAIFSVVNAVLLRPLPYPNPDQLVWIWETNLGSDIKTEPASIPNFMDWKAQTQSFQDMAAFARTAPTLTGGAEPERIQAAAVTANLFSVLGVEPAKGRSFLPEENRPGNERVVILSHSFWERRFNSSPDILDQAITLNGNPYTVVGVMPPDFKNPRPGTRFAADLWMPLAISPQAGRRSDFLSVVARLKQGVELQQAQAEMDAITARLAEQYPNTNAGWGATVLSLHERFVGDVKTSLWLLMGVVGFLLLIACANVANLLLARSASRQQEIALRTALGAGRYRLVQQLLTESVMLALAGGLVGWLLAMWGTELLIALSPDNIPRLNEVTLSGRVFLFTLAVSLATGLVFGLLPALHATNPNLHEVLKEGGRSATGGLRSGRIRGLLVISEVALALVLLIGAGLMIKSFIKLQGVDPGFNTDRILTLEMSVPTNRYPQGPQISAFYKQVLDRLQSLPGVEAAAGIYTLPLGGGDYAGFSVEGRPAPPPEQVVDAIYCSTTANYFQAMGISLLRGRGFAESYAPDSPRELLISETLARRYFPDEDPIGKRITTGNPQTGPWATIIGVVEDVKHESLNEASYPQMYAHYMQVPRRSFDLVVRSSSPDPLSLVPAVRSEIWSLDKDQPLYNIRTMDKQLADSIAGPRFTMILITIFGLVGLVLASVGIYGVMAYSVAQRTHEIGIRMALGAKPGDILRLVVGQGLLLTIVGVSVGLGVAFALTRIMKSLLFDVTATDPATFALITLVLAVIATLASYIPARRAMKVDPMVALRYE